MGDDNWVSIKDHAAFSRSIRNLLTAFRSREIVQALSDFPLVDVYDTDSHIVVEAEVPGFKKEELKVTWQDSYLMIYGTPGQGIYGQFKEQERSRKKFNRRIPIPVPVDTSWVQAELTDGVLYLALPKQEENRKEINIEIK